MTPDSDTPRSDSHADSDPGSARSPVADAAPESRVDPVSAPTSGTSEQPGETPTETTRVSRGSRILLLVGGAIALLLIGAAAGILIGDRIGDDTAATVPAIDSVDAGFAHDMIVHHDQGVLMAHYAEQNTSDPEISVMAYDIGATQSDQVGQMKGWLALWDLPEFSTGAPMAWMADDHGNGHGGGGSAAPTTGAAQSGGGALMPGMATDAEMAQLRDAAGVESDILFLQLMIRHHQGGVPMMADAADHAQSPVVRNFADKMVVAQDAEIAVMTQMLAQRGAEPFPAPAG